MVGDRLAHQVIGSLYKASGALRRDPRRCASELLGEPPVSGYQRLAHRLIPGHAWRAVECDTVATPDALDGCQDLVADLVVPHRAHIGLKPVHEPNLLSVVIDR